jgi:hypothetical protein
MRGIEFSSLQPKKRHFHARRMLPRFQQFTSPRTGLYGHPTPRGWVLSRTCKVN